MPQETAVTSFLAAQAVLMASLALLPQSPQGRSAWAVLLGREPLGAIGPWEVEWLIKAVMVYLMVLYMDNCGSSRPNALNVKAKSL